MLDPLSAFLIIIFGFLFNSLSAFLSFLVRLSFVFLIILHSSKSLFTLEVNALNVSSLILGIYLLLGRNFSMPSGVLEVSFSSLLSSAKWRCRASLLINRFTSLCISDISGSFGDGTNVIPLDNNEIWLLVSLVLDRLTTLLVSFIIDVLLTELQWCAFGVIVSSEEWSALFWVGLFLTLGRSFPVFGTSGVDFVSAVVRILVAGLTLIDGRILVFVSVGIVDLVCVCVCRVPVFWMSALHFTVMLCGSGLPCLLRCRHCLEPILSFLIVQYMFFIFNDRSYFFDHSVF